MKKNSVFNYEKSYLNSWYKLKKGFEEFYKQNGSDLSVKPAETMFLSKIYYNDGISQRELAHLLNVSEANITKTFKKLEAKDLAYKTIDEENNARRRLHLTKKGEEVFEKSTELFKNFDQLLFEGLTEAEIEKMEDQLYEIANKSLSIMEK
ncbi:MarR family winged helix-turn-helix transcriptional regulator [uncultured Methanobrevibacter sp.]|uniref:MarR family winged helix-turn-helix transcriptional regulator n=1 Tax=uncultured Methanobrevibacter sp. TaxID=253161 RepID=UPI0025D9B345|nr:MarR family transcriptional regulator [uncultured Methanobrevibacter sp.]